MTASVGSDAAPAMLVLLPALINAELDAMQAVQLQGLLPLLPILSCNPVLAAPNWGFERVQLQIGSPKLSGRTDLLPVENAAEQVVGVCEGQCWEDGLAEMLGLLLARLQLPAMLPGWLWGKG